MAAFTFVSASASASSGSFGPASTSRSLARVSIFRALAGAEFTYMRYCCQYDNLLHDWRGHNENGFGNYERINRNYRLDGSNKRRGASEVKVLSTHAALEVLSELGPQFERATGNTLSFSYDPANVIKRNIENGATFDVVLITRSAIDDLTKQGKIVPDTRINIGRSGLGVAVRKGAPKPDITTVEAFKQTLLAAKSVIRSTEGNSGLYFERLTDRLGIADQMKGKVTLGPSGRVAEFVARGEVELAVQQVSELLPVAGAEFVGPFPPEVQLLSIQSPSAQARRNQTRPRLSSTFSRHRRPLR